MQVHTIISKLSETSFNIPNMDKSDKAINYILCNSCLEWYHMQRDYYCNGLTWQSTCWQVTARDVKALCVTSWHCAWPQPWSQCHFTMELSDVSHGDHSIVYYCILDLTMKTTLPMHHSLINSDSFDKNHLNLANVSLLQPLSEHPLSTRASAAPLVTGEMFVTAHSS